MKVRYMNPFIRATYEIFEEMVGERPKIGKPFVTTGMRSVSPYNIMIGLLGELNGHITFSFDIVTATISIERILSGMGMSDMNIDEVFNSSIGEICNMIMGRGSIYLSEIGLTTDITPPIFIKGKTIEISDENNKSITIPMILGFGTFEVSFLIKEIEYRRDN